MRVVLVSDEAVSCGEGFQREEVVEREGRMWIRNKDRGGKELW